MQLQLVLCLVASSLCLHPAAALVPTICAGNVTNPVSVCCPTPPGMPGVCGGRNRGQCTRINAFKQYNTLPRDFAVDDRVMWPMRFFQYGCQCDARFWGFDCGECFFGWKGPNCDVRDVRVRRNIFELDKEEKHQFHVAVRSMRDVMSPYSILIEKSANGSDPMRNPQFVPASVHYWLVFVHRYASRKTLVESPQQCSRLSKVDLNHGGPGFITWHRYFTMTIERELSKIIEKKFGKADFGLPYWDWVDATWCEVCSNDLVGGPGKCDNHGQRLHSDSAFHHWDEICSPPSVNLAGGCVSCHAADRFKKMTREWKTLSMPKTEEVQFGLNLPLFYIPGEIGADVFDMSKCSFNKYIEGHCAPKELYAATGTMHNKVHNSVKGSFCCAATAPNDPLFVLHHSQVSRIVHMWQLKHKPSVQSMANIGTIPGHARQDFMVGFYPPIRHEEVFSDSDSLGYVYDSLEFGQHVRDRLLAQGKMPRPTLEHFKTCKPGYLHPEHKLHSHHFKDELLEYLLHHRQRPQTAIVGGIRRSQH